MADMKRIKGRIAETIYPNGTGAITAESHQALLLEMVDDINTKKADQSELVATQESLEALTDTVNNLPLGGGDVKADGVYPNLTAGDLAGRGESVPASFGFRASGGKSIKDGRAYIKRIKGNSVVWNNMVDTRGYEGQLFITTGIRIVKGHKYLLYRTETNQALYLIPTVNGAENYEMSIHEGEHSGIFQAQYSDDNGQGTVYAEAYCGACIISDLTKMFQAGNEPSTIEEFNARVATLGIDMYAYNEGQVIHCNTESIKSVGDNAWDEQWEEGAIDNNTGTITPSNSHIRSKNYIKVISGETYNMLGNFIVIYYDENYNQVDWWSVGGSRELTIPNNVQYLKLYANGITYNNGIMISLVHSGWKQDTDAGYQPYWQDILPLPIIRKYFPDGMKKAGTAHDEIRYNKASGKWEYSKGKIKSVDLGTLSWYYTADFGGYYSDMLYTANTDFGGICSAYPFVGKYINVNDKEMGVIFGQCILIKDSAYTDAASFKAAMQGVILYYESNDWEWVELDAEDQNFRDYYNVADFGTEMSQSNVPSAAFSADIIYQFNAVDMIREHELEITELQSIIATMQAQLTSLINGGQ